MIIGVISDTHGLLRPQVFEKLDGADTLIHAGDIGAPEVLTELEAIAPVYAVYGNTDHFPLIETLPETRLLEMSGVSIFITHIGGKPKEMRSRYREIDRARIVIFGHSHKPLQLEENNTLFFNPGSAGPRRFSLPVTVGKLYLEGSNISSEIIPLPT